MKKIKVRNSPKYPKPHNIEIAASNEALEQREKERLHARLKYEARFGNEQEGWAWQYQGMRRSAPYKRLPYRN
ncbi:hypothetical protein HYV89_00995 [Candidatus Woesearchaeota archaeon]|nr:hypothetical protein [Candidatus Woesearchaeota archaeon]